MLRPITELADSEIEQLLIATDHSRGPVRQVTVEFESGDPGTLKRFIEALSALRNLGRFTRDSF